ncbi:MAG: DNA phosphorothioation system restriction enzyme [Carboxydocellales bacterium]
MDNQNSVHEIRVIDNKTISMGQALQQLIPLGKSLSMAVGYFYLSGYQLTTDVFNEMANKQTIRIIMGNRTDSNTALEIHEGTQIYNANQYKEKKPTNPVEAITKEIESISEDTDAAYAAYQLKDLIAYGKLKIKVYTGPSDYFHAKVYLIGREDEYDGYAIVGSSNFSRGGFTGNSELNVLTKDSYPNLLKWFDELWNSSEVENFDIKLIELIENQIIKPSNYVSPIKEPLISDLGEIRIPAYIEVRDYQKEAIITWFKSQGRGILEMATGTGKTITALTTASKLFQQFNNLAIIIVCPYKHLVTQWEKECKKFNLNPILGYESRLLWEEDLNSKITSFNIGAINCFSLITTNTTFASESMQESLKKIKGNSILIADEAHHLGAEHLRTILPENMEFRLGLSATPDRWYDEEGSVALKSYFENGVIFKYGLKEAIGTHLTQYYYHPHLILLNDDESEYYIELSKKIAKCFPKGEDYELSQNSYLQNLLIKRARLLSGALNKLAKIRELMDKQRDSKFNIFYCGDAKVEGERQIEQVIRILGSDLGMKVHSFTSEENEQQRKDLLKRFDSGELQGLVAIRCLDEGVDVPATQNAYILASSTNPREFIQRRGRILRKFPGKQFSYIHDFIVIPRDITEISKLETEIFNIERKMMARELRRFKEFADLAVNGPQARTIILEIAEQYNLLDL